jgi:hypothetical protein
MPPISISQADARADFTANQLQALVARLKDTVRYTELAEVGRPSDLAIDDESMTHDGFRFSSSAMVPLCAVLGKGLAQLVSDLGSGRHPDRAAAADVFNRVVVARWGNLRRGWRLVKCHSTKTIDGLLGSRYVWFDNQDFLSKVLASHGSVYRFHSATLDGRRLAVRLTHGTAVIKLRDKVGQAETYRPGTHYVNSEAGVCAAVAAFRALLRESAGTFSLGPVPKGAERVVHAGGAFHSNVDNLLRAAAESPPHVDRYAARLKSMATETIGSLKPRPNSQADRLRRDLVTAGVAATARRRVIASLASRGDALSQGYDVAVEESLSQATLLELYHALCAAAGTLRSAARESAERAAGLIISGKIFQ